MELKTKADLLKKLRLFSECPDDDNVIFKQKIQNALMNCPELLCAVNEKSLEDELFNKDGTINYDGEWDKFFSDSFHDGNIRPYLFIPDTQDDVRNYICYQTHFEETPRYNAVEKYCLVTFTIFVHAGDRVDFNTGLPRHDLIAAIIRDKLNWTNIFGTQCRIISDRESMTDYKYVVSTLIFQCTMPNNIVQTSIYKNNGKTTTSTNVINKLGRM
jgi:hypothetical protein